MLCYTCDKYDKCNQPRKCSYTLQGCSAYHKEQTNEEWLRSASTEELAEEIYDIAKHCYGWTFSKKAVLKWLRNTRDE